MITLIISSITSDVGVFWSVGYSCDWYFIHQNTYSVKFIHFSHIPLNGYIFHYTCSHTPNMMDTSFPRCSHIRLNSYFYSRCPHISLDTSFIPHVCVLSNVYFIHYVSTRFVKWILFSLHVHTLCSMILFHRIFTHSLIINEYFFQ